MGLKLLALILLIISALGNDLTSIRTGLFFTGVFIVMDILDVEYLGNDNK